MANLRSAWPLFALWPICAVRGQPHTPLATPTTMDRDALIEPPLPKRRRMQAMHVQDVRTAYGRHGEHVMVVNAERHQLTIRVAGPDVNGTFTVCKPGLSRAKRLSPDVIRHVVSFLGTFDLSALAFEELAMVDTDEIIHVTATSGEDLALDLVGGHVSINHPDNMDIWVRAQISSRCLTLLMMAF